MPPSRRNLVVILMLCVLTIYVAAGFKMKGQFVSSHLGVPTSYIPYSQNLPAGPDESFYEIAKAEGSAPKNKTEVASFGATSASIGARAYIVADLNSEKVYLKRNEHAVLPVASMSKLVTAFVAMDHLAEESRIEIGSEQASLPANGAGIDIGEKFTLEEALYPLLLNSSNVMAEALASASGRQDFLENMTGYAWEIGMPSTFFADASGLDPSNAASASDLLALAKYLYRFRPEVLELTRNARYTIASTTYHGAHTFVSTHPFVSDPGFIGGKTGRTPEAGETMLTIMMIKGKPVAIIVLGSQYGGRETDTRKLIEKVRNMI